MLKDAILVLEDDYTEFSVFTKQLYDFGFVETNFLHCKTIEELESEAVKSFSPTFILADLSLLGSTVALNTFYRVQQRFNAVPIAVIIGIEETDIAIKCIQAGADNFLIKGNVCGEQLKGCIEAGKKHKLKMELEQLRPYKNIFDDSPLPMFLVNSITLEFITVNKQAIAIYGFNEEEFRTFTLHDLNGESKDGSTLTLHFPVPLARHIKKDGNEIFVEMLASTTEYNSISSLFITVTDITEKVLAAREEKMAKQRLDAIFNCAHDGILLTNDEGKFVDVNPAGRTMLGYTEDEFSILTASDIIIKIASLNKDETLWKKFYETGSESGIVELKAKNDRIIICHFNSTQNILPGLHLSIITNITEKEIARRKVDEERRKTEIILESITDCFYSVDNNWTINYWNKAAEELLGMPREHVLGKKLWDIYYDSHGLKHYEIFSKALHQQVAIQVEDFFYELNLWLDITVYPLQEGLAIYFKNITDRKKRDLEIMQARSNHAALIDSSPDLIWSIDTEMKLVSFNDAYKQRIKHLTEITIFEGLQLPLNYLEPQQYESWKSYYNRGLKGESFSVEECIVDKARETIKYFDLTFSPILDINTANVIALACYSHDITEQKQQQLLIKRQNEQLKDNEEHLKKISANLEKIMNSSLDIICSINSKGEFVQVSAASRFVLGYEPDDMIGRRVFDFVDQETLEVTKSAVKNIRKGISNTNLENVFIHKNGNGVPIIWSAKWDDNEKTMFAVGRDASAIKEAENLKHKAEQRFSALVHKGADMVATIDVEGNYLYVSPNTETILGYRPDDLINTNVLDKIHPDDQENALRKLKEVLSQKEVLLQSFRYRNADGIWKWLETIGTNQIDNPTIKGIVLNTRDVTKRVEIETEREVMLKELLKTNADLKQFSFITSHNLRAPLSNITGILNILNYAALDEYNAQMLDLLHKSTKQLAKTIDDLIRILIIKNNVNIELENVNVTGSYNLVRNIFSNGLQQDSAITITNFEVERIMFNKTYFESILVNLFSNSIKYKAKTRSLEITISTYKNEEGNTILKFSDNGTGIDLYRHRHKVFGLYQRFHEDSEGQGLGLFIINSQIVALKGKIDIESEVDKGTTFIITFNG